MPRRYPPPRRRPRARGDSAREQLNARARESARFIGDVIRGARDDRVTGLAAEVAFFGLLSLLPGFIALAAVVAVLGDLLGGTMAQDVEQAVVGWADRVLTDDAASITAAIADLFRRGNGDVFSVAIVVSLWSGSRGIDAIMRSVVLVANAVEPRPWWKRRLISLGLLVGTATAAAVVLAMLVVGPLLGGGRAVASALGLGSAFAAAWLWLRIPVAVAALVGWPLVLLHIAHPRTDSWRSDLPGALVTSGLWIVASVGFRGYLASVGASNPALGALGGAVIVLVWFWLLAIGLLLGAEVAQRLRERHDS